MPSCCASPATAPSKKANTPPETVAFHLVPRAASAAGARVGRGPRTGPRPTRGRDHDRLHHRPARHHPERSCRPRAQAGDQGRGHAGDRTPGCCHRPHQRGGARRRARIARRPRRSGHMARPADRPGRAGGSRPEWRASRWRRLAATRGGRRHATARHQAGADRRSTPAAAGRHAGRADRPPPAGCPTPPGRLSPACAARAARWRKAAAPTARPPTGSCRRTMRRRCCPERDGLWPCRSIRRGRRQPRSRSRSCGISTSRPCRRAGTACAAGRHHATCPNTYCCGSRPISCRRQRMATAIGAGVLLGGNEWSRSGSRRVLGSDGCARVRRLGATRAPRRE